MKPTLNNLVPIEEQKELFISNSFTCPRCKKTVPDVCLLAIPIDKDTAEIAYRDDCTLVCICTDCYHAHYKKTRTAVPFEYLDERQTQFNWFLEHRQKSTSFEQTQNKAIVDDIERHLGGEYTLSNKARFEIDRTRSRSNAIKMLGYSDSAARRTIEFGRDDHITPESADKYIDKIHAYAYTENLPKIKKQVTIMSGLCGKKGYTDEQRKEFKRLLMEYCNILAQNNSEEKILAHLKAVVNPELWNVSSWIRCSAKIRARINVAKDVRL